MFITLTTIPDRIQKLHMVIESLFRQSVKPTGILLWLSEAQFRGPGRVPILLRRQESRGLTIRFCSGTWPHKKLIPALRQFPEAVLVTTDDDKIYPRSWLESLVHAHVREPRIVLCHRARRITFEPDGEPASYAHWAYGDRSLLLPSHSVLPTGVGGVLYPAGSLHPDVLDEATAAELCPTADDLWFKVMALRNGTPARCLNASWKPYLDVPGTQETSLWDINHAQMGNDKQWRSLLGH